MSACLKFTLYYDAVKKNMDQDKWTEVPKTPYVVPDALLPVLAHHSQYCTTECHKFYTKFVCILFKS